MILLFALWVSMIAAAVNVGRNSTDRPECAGVHHRVYLLALTALILGAIIVAWEVVTLHRLPHQLVVLGISVGLEFVALQLAAIFRQHPHVGCTERIL